MAAYGCQPHEIYLKHAKIGSADGFSFVLTDARFRPCDCNISVHDCQGSVFNMETELMQPVCNCKCNCEKYKKLKEIWPKKFRIIED